MLQLASHTGLSPSAVLLSRRFCSLHAYNVAVLLPRSCVATVTVWALPRSLATTKGIIIYFLFLQVLRCFSSLRQLSRLARVTVLQTAGLSHSEIFGSKVICTYPKLIAAYHVLHRLCEPRHPPYALSYFLLIKDKARIHKATFIAFILTASPFEAHTFSCQVKSYLAI